MRRLVKNLFGGLGSRKGFTLIELLIVIAVIGILAVAVLAAINPVEQLRKARDAERFATASELFNATQRYQTTNSAGCYPWNPPNASGVCTAVANIPGVDGTVITSTWFTGATYGFYSLTNTAQELKLNFSNKTSITGSDIFAYYDATQTTAPFGVCFEPESISGRTQGVYGPTYSAEDGTGATPGSGCGGAYDGTAAGTCWVCAR